MTVTTDQRHFGFARLRGPCDLRGPSTHLAAPGACKPVVALTRSKASSTGTHAEFYGYPINAYYQRLLSNAYHQGSHTNVDESYITYQDSHL